MSIRFQKPASFAMGCVFSAAVILLLGASGNLADPHRYDADFDTIMGGLGGLTVEITDHNKQKAYLYVFPRKPEQEDGTTSSPQLVATIDLESAGKPELEAKMVLRKPVEKEE